MIGTPTLCLGVCLEHQHCVWLCLVVFELCVVVFELCVIDLTAMIKVLISLQEGEPRHEPPEFTPLGGSALLSPSGVLGPTRGGAGSLLVLHFWTVSQTG